MKTMGKFCAHRGVSALMPENTLPAFAAAMALGADEIEFDVRLTKDGRTVISHDPNLKRVCGVDRMLGDCTLAELMEMNVDQKHGWQVSFCTPQQVFEQLAGRIGFNIHLKEAGENGCLVKEIVQLAKQYHFENGVYLAAAEGVLDGVKRHSEGLSVAAIQTPKDTASIYELAVEYQCDRVQFWHGIFDEEIIRRLHDKEISCNVFFADTAEGYRTYFDMGIDTILTNCYEAVAPVVKSRQAK